MCSCHPGAVSHHVHSCCFLTGMCVKSIQWGYKKMICWALCTFAPSAVTHVNAYLLLLQCQSWIGIEHCASSTRCVAQWLAEACICKWQVLLYHCIPILAAAFPAQNRTTLILFVQHCFCFVQRLQCITSNNCAVVQSPNLTLMWVTAMSATVLPLASFTNDTHAFCKNSASQRHSWWRRTMRSVLHVILLAQIGLMCWESSTSTRCPFISCGGHPCLFSVLDCFICWYSDEFMYCGIGTASVLSSIVVSVKVSAV